MADLFQGRPYAEVSRRLPEQGRARLRRIHRPRALAALPHPVLLAGHRAQLRENLLPQ
jgi:hypothetical protein